MINKQRVRRIRAAIYACIILLALLPALIMIGIGVKTVNMLADLTTLLSQRSPAASWQAPADQDGEILPEEDDLSSPQPAPQAKAEEEPLSPQGQAVEGGGAGSKANRTDRPENPSAATGGYVENTYLPVSYPRLCFDTVPIFAPPSPNTLYLTFDNTPSYHGEDILQVLDKHGVRATFFVWWNDSMGSANLDFYKRLAAEGHQIGIHSASNGTSFAQLYSSADAFLQEFDEMFALLSQDVGVKPRAYRLPGGSVSPGNSQRQAVLEEIKAELDARGFVQYDWTASAQDAVPYSLSKGEVLRNIKESLRENRRAVVLAHDGTNSPATVQALDQFIGEYKSQGYTFGVLEDDTYPVSFLDGAGGTQP